MDEFSLWVLENTPKVTKESAFNFTVATTIGWGVTFFIVHFSV